MIEIKLVYALIIVIGLLANVILILVKWRSEKNGRNKIISNPNNPFPCKEHDNLIRDNKKALEKIDDSLLDIHKFCSSFGAKFDSLERSNEEWHRTFIIKLNGFANRR